MIVVVVMVVLNGGGKTGGMKEVARRGEKRRAKERRREANGGIYHGFIRTRSPRNCPITVLHTADRRLVGVKDTGGEKEESPYAG